MTLLDDGLAVASTPTDLHIAGGWRPAETGATFPVLDPATEAVLAEVADGTPADALAALDAAAAAQPAWAATAPRARSEVLARAYELMIARTEELALLVTLEMGKPLAESRGEVAYAAEFFRWFAEEAVRIHGEYRTAPAGDVRIVTSRRPVGPCLLITPWNFPLAMVTRKVAPALAAGCTAVLKPAEATPLSALALAALLAEAGAPAGVVNVVTTMSPAAVTASLLADQRLRKLSFTGSTEVGRHLLAQAAPHILRTSMELGGNAPFLVLADADVDAAVDGAAIAKLRNMGQSCVAANRFLVHERVAGEFQEKLAARFGSLTVGAGIDPGTDIGPLIDAEQRARAVALLDDAVSRGGQILVGGRVPDRPGSFLEPTVVAMHDEALMDQAEIFAPIAAVRTFEHDDAIVAAANDSDHGLVSFVYTQDLGKALRIMDALESGMVGVNRGLVSNAAAPFGGIKQSGLGREGGSEGIHEYLSVKYAALNG